MDSTDFEAQPLAKRVKRSDNGARQSLHLGDAEWDLIDPNPDIHILFVEFDKQFFWGRLGGVTVAWSKRMTSCAGVCSYQGFNGLCKITLSECLLKLRPRKDLVETLLHEMIHAYLFVTHNNKDRNGHGPEFHQHMHRINDAANLNISVYHSFHDEVCHYKTHWWRCNGPCHKRPPYYGVVKRSMNRAPGPSDRWYPEHLRLCGGIFVKIREPEPMPQKKAVPSQAAPSSATSQSVADFVRKHWTGKQDEQKKKAENEEQKLTKMAGKGVETPAEKAMTFACPICAQDFTEVALDLHLDECINVQKAANHGKDLCSFCGRYFTELEMLNHMETCYDLKESFGDGREVMGEQSACLICYQMVNKSEMEKHIEDCIPKLCSPNEANIEPPPHGEASANAEVIVIDDDDDSDNNDVDDNDTNDNYDNNDDDLVECPSCPKRFTVLEINDHLDNCLSID